MIAIALIGFMEAISVAKAMATRTRQNLSADRELIGQHVDAVREVRRLFGREMVRTTCSATCCLTLPQC